MPDPSNYWVRIPRPDGFRYFVRFATHHPRMTWTMHRSYKQAYCFASFEDANRVVATLKKYRIDANVVSVKAPPPPPPPPPPFSVPFTPSPNIQLWIDKILEVGSALGKESRDRIDAGYRALAQEHHPDHGGQLGDMQLLNDACTWLRANYREDDVPF